MNTKRLLSCLTQDATSKGKLLFTSLLTGMAFSSQAMADVGPFSPSVGATHHGFSDLLEESEGPGLENCDAEEQYLDALEICLNTFPTLDEDQVDAIAWYVDNECNIDVESVTCEVALSWHLGQPDWVWIKSGRIPMVIMVPESDLDDEDSDLGNNQPGLIQF